MDKVIGSKIIDTPELTKGFSSAAVFSQGFFKKA